MDKNNFIAGYEINKLCFKNIHSAGSDLFFDKPCIGYVKKGRAKILYNGVTYCAKEGDLIYIAFRTKYQSIWYGYPDVEWYSVNFEFYSKYSFYDYRFQIIENYPSHLFEKMYKTYSTSPMVSISYFYQLLDDLYLKMKSSPKVKAYAVLEPAINYIENNYSKPIYIEKLGELCHVSKSTLFNQFKAYLGVTPITYKHNLMIQHAIDLLSNTDMSVEEISGMVGFSSANYFRKIFVKLTGKTPKELRKR